MRQRVSNRCYPSLKSFPVSTEFACYFLQKADLSDLCSLTILRVFRFQPALLLLPLLHGGIDVEMGFLDLHEQLLSCNSLYPFVKGACDRCFEGIGVNYDGPVSTENENHGVAAV